MTKKKSPIDPLNGPKMALAGDIVAMDEALNVTRDGRLYIDKGAIVAIRRATDPVPSGFENVSVLNTGGTMFPGLIELHNHLAYNALQLWQVPKKYNNRDQWSGIPEYRKLVSGPMTVVGKSQGLLPPLIRYVEAKCLISGVTTSQGIALFSNAGIRRFYRGIVRNVEETDDENLPEVETRIADVEAQSAQKFLARLKRETCFLLHLSEGVDAKAREHFLALNFAPNEWAITPQLAGIHCAALKPEDFTVLGQLGGAMVWSPLSNLLLYGGTANISHAIAAGVRIGIGSDWSPSGSKNLLGELKVAWLVAQQTGGLARHDIIAMATRTAAKILGWGSVLGTIEPGKRADLIVVDGTSEDPYDQLIRVKETGITLVVINGVPRFGRNTFMSALGATGETLTIDGQKRTLFLKQDTQDPLVGAIKLSQATATLKDALSKLPALAKELEQPQPVAMIGHRRAPTTWQLALDEIEDTGFDLRPRLRSRHSRQLTGPTRRAAVAAKPLSQILQPLELDPLTVVDDPDFLPTLAMQRNLPQFVKDGLLALYG
jgi:cytosine/adenosine deaminase-related metal-dependent hydrolase